MYKAVLVAVAAAALAAPAVAQQNQPVVPPLSEQIAPAPNQEMAPPRDTLPENAQGSVQDSVQGGTEGGIQGVPDNNGQEQPAAPRDLQAPSSHAITPDLLSERQVRDIQQALDAHGTPVPVDGRWGAAMPAAILNFQKNENLITQNGELDPLTLMALGLNPLTFGLSETGETTGQASPGSAPPHDAIDFPDERPPGSGDQDDR